MVQVRGWDRRNAYYFQLINSLAEHYNFDIDTPFDELPEKIQQVVLYGSGKEVIEFQYINERSGFTLLVAIPSKAFYAIWNAVTGKPSPMPFAERAGAFSPYPPLQRVQRHKAQHSSQACV